MHSHFLFTVWNCLEADQMRPSAAKCGQIQRCFADADFSDINPLVCNVTQFIPIATKYYRQSVTIQEAFQKDWSKGEKNQEIKIQLLCANPEPDGTRIIGINTLLKHCPSGEETADPVRDRFRVGRD